MNLAWFGVGLALLSSGLASLGIVGIDLKIVWFIYVVAGILALIEAFRSTSIRRWRRSRSDEV